MNDGFYRAFEEKFRGSREMIKLRLQVYLPFILPLCDFWPITLAVDLGCGRGEWLELLAENGFDAQGVDSNDDMLSACRERTLKVHTGDALAFIQNLPDDSQAIVSGFHIAEHIPFEVLQELVSEALRVLEPGGLLILETPNPENLVVGTSGFFLDPTHKRPIPAELLAFVPEYTGFKRTKVLRLQESLELLKNPAPSLLAVLNGVSPDYAVVAQKDGPAELHEALDAAFDVDYGLTLEVLSQRYQHQAEQKAEQAEQKAEQAEQKAEQAEQKAEQAEQKAELAIATSEQVLLQLRAVYASTSWRITAPMRTVGHWIKKISPAYFKPKVRLLAHHAALYVRCRPWLHRAALGFLHRFPFVRRYVFTLLGVSSLQQGIFPVPQIVPTEYASLTPRARQIYTDLKAAIERHQQGRN